MAKIATEIAHGYSLLQETLIEKGLVIDANNLVRTETRESISLCWASAPNLSYLFGGHTTIDHYIETLERRDFNFAFIDGGIMQIFYKIENEEITKHRLCYVPCPIDYKKEEWEGYTIDEVLSLQDNKSLRESIKMASPVRFDFDLNFRDEKHEHSHVTINKDSCRVPAYGAISLGHFARFILRYFYETEISIEADLNEVRPTLYRRTLPHEMSHELHFDTSTSY
ncbi:DUF2290 domain-containing protein [Pseudomonas sp. DP-17]|uniref:DUF2290 domain-containing protein n=1 Tax=Pseudomonas sp. DP-17 TaxID=1580486 RepID=UPI001EFADCAF|nr:DUF2290 domain-containing protein [Pseudomonas sp. DP-17]MCG8911436.1 DUF2290 domain-containing protein [Pseudomonas sp. DP-17]